MSPRLHTSAYTTPHLTFQIPSSHAIRCITRRSQVWTDGSKPHGLTSPSSTCAICLAKYLCFRSLPPQPPMLPAMTMPACSLLSIRRSARTASLRMAMVVGDSSPWIPPYTAALTRQRHDPERRNAIWHDKVTAPSDDQWSSVLTRRVDGCDLRYNDVQHGTKKCL